MTKTHLDYPPLAKLLERCACLWEHKIPRVGTMNAYATKKSLVLFLDFNKGHGWTMLTENPSNSIAENAKALEAMIDGSEETVIVTYARGEILETYASTKAMRSYGTIGALDGIIDLINGGAGSGSCPMRPDIKFRVMRIRR